VRSEVWATDKELPATNMKLMEELLANSVAHPRLYVLLISVFAALALILTAVGVYGVVAYSVTQQTRDIGIRMALGARPIDVFKHVTGQALLLALIGLGIGLVLAFGASRLISSLLYGAKATDLIILGATSLILLAVALLASYIPARKATRIDPIVALRYE